jgi:NAD(P)-dependent dehydrogenase (short-subunit alcohol dehydrogenase family)
MSASSPALRLSAAGGAVQIKREERMKDLAGKTAFVTGAGSGIGLGIATRLAQAGVEVMLCDIEQAALESAVGALKNTNADVEGVQADVSLKEELRAAAEATVNRFGEVHILVNNAGVTGGGGYGAWNDASWNWTIGVNLMAVIWGVEIFGPLIERHGLGGHVVNTASVAGLMSSSGNAYNVTKYGVVALSEGLRVDLAPRGIGVSVLCPGIIRTRILESVRNLPGRFAGAEKHSMIDAPSGDTPEWMSDAIARVANGADPLFVGELVREAIEANSAYIFTDNEFEPIIEARFSAIKAAFDQIRAHKPAPRSV